MGGLKAVSTLTLCVALLLLIGSGCTLILPSPPPAMSMAKFVRGSNPAKNGKVGASAGALVYGSDGSSQLHIFAAEGAGTFHIAKRYDLAVTAGNWKGTVEGNAILLESEGARIGLIHGLGWGLIADLETEDPEDDEDWWMGLDLSAGFIAEFPSPGLNTPFLGVKYTYGDSFLSDEDEEDPNESVDNSPVTQYVTVNAGIQVETTSLRITPELIFSKAFYTVDHREGGVTYSEDNDFWLFLVGVTIAAPF